MAYDTVVDKAVLESGLKNIADAIRGGTGNTAVLSFPDGFVSQANAMAAEEKAIIERTITSIYRDDVVRVAPYSFMRCNKLTSATFNNAASVGEAAFQDCTALTSVNVPTATVIGNDAFMKCTKLVSLALPKVTEIRTNAFDGCTALANISLPGAKIIGQYAFASCTALKELDLPKVTSIPNHAFRKATNLSTLYLRNDSVVTLENVGAFYGIEVVFVYVPGNLIESYKTAENWSALYNDGVVSFLAIPGTEVEPALISFSIDRVAYQAEEGMTWAQWCDSSYNTSVGLYIGDDSLVYCSDGYICYDDFTQIPSSDIIQSGHAYTVDLI